MGAKYNPPSSGAVGNNNYSNYLAGNIAFPNATITPILSLAIPVAGIYVIEGKVSAGDNAAELGLFDVWLGPSNSSSTGAFDATTMALGEVAGRAQYDTATLISVQTLTAGQIVYLMGYANTASVIVWANTQLQTIPRATGLTAWRIF